MENEITSLTDEQMLDYIFSDIPQDEVEKITKFLVENEEYGHAVDGLMSLCLDKKFNRQQAKEFLDSIEFKGDIKYLTINQKRIR